MTLALSLFFWDDADWSGEAPAEPTTAETPEARGSGKNRKRREYTRADDEFWEIRERWLRAMHEPLPFTQDIPIDTTKVLTSVETQHSKSDNFYITALPRYEAEKAAILSLAETASTLTQLQSYGKRLIELNKAIQQARRKRQQLRKRKLTQLVALGTALVELLR